MCAHKNNKLLVLLFFSTIAFFTSEAMSSSDDTSAATGDPISGLTPYQQTYFESGKERFMETDSVQGKVSDTGAGLGPRYNMTSCGGCHAYPSPGGSSPQLNPQIAAASVFGAHNTIPDFITQDGPVRVARFKYNSDGSRDGGVHDLYVISGMVDAPNCNITQPNFAQAEKNNNLIFRIPTPIFGAGLIEAIPDSAILANMNANKNSKKALGIGGHENRMKIDNVRGTPNISGNDGTISRFGWKAQNKSLLIFAAEAYNVEQGVTNELFPNERDETPGCVVNSLPEDYIHYEASTPIAAMSDIAGFAQYMRFLAPPQPKPLTAAGKEGARLFSTIGCALCHTPSFTTGPSTIQALSNKQVNLYSDLLVHHMGPNLADDIIQGNAGPDEFRTAPLWGLGGRLFYLHDGRTSDLTEAILAHASSDLKCSNRVGTSCASEANRVIENFNRLSSQEKAEIIEFLKSL